jgi:hypothetical protein
MVMGADRLGPVSDCIANYRPVLSSERASFPKNQIVGLERGPHSLVSTTEKLLDRKVAVPV